ncbi:MAG: L-ribulose-5-phosphate 4-epimerase AraD [Bacteroidales bacterium]|nr:L-ribulose-5-phosphate 4-epimerase AraD [Bacteroidales bacterium]
MEINDLKKRVYDANIELVDKGLVIYTWGNVSEIDRDKGVIAIKPRGIEYSDLEWQDISVVDLEGKPLAEGQLLPSVDLDYHIAMYRSFKDIGGIAHTHSVYATVFSQALLPIPCLGTTHADHFYGSIPCVPYLSAEEIESNYEYNAGIQITEHFRNNSIDPNSMRAVLCGGHGPFTWGKDGAEAVEFSVILEEVAKMAYMTLTLGGNTNPIPQYMLDKHYLRKYGKSAYFYQKK